MSWLLKVSLAPPVLVWRLSRVIVILSQVQIVMITAGHPEKWRNGEIKFNQVEQTDSLTPSKYGKVNVFYGGKRQGELDLEEQIETWNVGAGNWQQLFIENSEEKMTQWSNIFYSLLVCLLSSRIESLYFPLGYLSKMSSFSKCRYYISANLSTFFHIACNIYDREMK